MRLRFLAATISLILLFPDASHSQGFLILDNDLPAYQDDRGNWFIILPNGNEIQAGQATEAQLNENFGRQPVFTPEWSDPSPPETANPGPGGVEDESDEPIFLPPNLERF